MRLGKFFKKGVNVLENEIKEFDLKENVNKVKDLFGDMRTTIKDIEKDLISPKKELQKK